MKNVTITENGAERETTEADFEIKEYIQLTEDEIIARQTVYELENYVEVRAEAYPSLAEQADMAYWDRQNGTTTLDDAISAVKLQFPKS